MLKDIIVKPLPPQSFFETFFDLSPLVAQLLYNRELSDEEEVKTFLHPEYKNLYDPFIFQDMRKATTRIWEAIINGEKIFIYGDYDADAVTANAVLQQTFRYLGVTVDSYIPDRFTEGYGLNVEAFEKIKEAKAKVVITVDCGTNSVDVAEFCLENGIDLIITDHHEITGEVPNSFALINPKNPSDVYPDNQITGVGVAYKLAQALLLDKQNVCLAKKIEETGYIEGWDKWLLDLVAIGTVADCHSLLGENRILVSLGLRVLAKTKWVGLRSLLQISGTDPSHLDTRTLGFGLAPRINAAGRLEHADVALKLLLETDPALAAELASGLEQINKRRQDLTMRVVSEAKEQAELISDREILLVTSSDWPKGVVGLAAGRLAEIYKRPVIVLETGEEESTGSARTGSEFDLVSALKSTAHLLVKYGGHKQAAGLTLKNKNVSAFYQALLDYAKSLPKDANKKTTREVEAALEAHHMSLAMVDELSLFEPFGMGNPKPQFVIFKAEVVQFRFVGSTSQHLQLTLKIGDVVVDSIGFSMGYLAEKLILGAIIDIVVELLADSWNGNRKFKLRLLEIDIHE